MIITFQLDTSNDSILDQLFLPQLLNEWSNEPLQQIKMVETHAPTGIAQ